MLGCGKGGRLLNFLVMIRPFAFRDLPLVHRLHEHGVSLHTKSALTESPHPLRGALFYMLVGGNHPTLVLKERERRATGFIQLHLAGGKHHARILYLSSSVDGGLNSEQVSQAGQDTGVWLSLLDEAMVIVGQRGMHSLVAEVDELGEALPILRQAGFAVYTRQDIWVLTAEDITAVTPTLTLQKCTSQDEWDVQLLYTNTVPRLVQLVEPMPPTCDGNGWVLREENEVTAFVHVYEGAEAIWLAVFVHPNAENRAGDIVATAVADHPPKPTKPIYCCIRRYQSWMQSALEPVGFQLWSSQAVMVKHTVQHTRKPLRELITSLEKQGITASTPVIGPYSPTKSDH